jgi:hypothetical protein
VTAVRRLQLAFLPLLLLAAGCAKRQAQAPAPAPPPPPPQPKQNIVVLLPDPEGKPSGVTVTNVAGMQTLREPYQAVRLGGADVPPPAPVSMDQAEVRRIFGSVLDALPAPEVVFVLHYDLGSEVLLPESKAKIPEILQAIQERRSTEISIVGHTDTMADSKFNYQLGLRRAEGIAEMLRVAGVDSANIIVASHGDADLAVKTGRGVSEVRNRLVEVIVR